MTTAATLDALAATARLVADQYDERERAGADLRAAKAELLERVLEAVRPSCRALASPVGSSMTVSPAGTTTEPAGWRGLYLAGHGPTVAQKAGTQRGRYAGARLLLRADGALVELSYDGPWSGVPGEVSTWRTSAREVSPVEAVEIYEIEPILDAIGQALASQIEGKSAARAIRLKDQADRIYALATLVRRWR